MKYHLFSFKVNYQISKTGIFFFFNDHQWVFFKCNCLFNFWIFGCFDLNYWLKIWSFRKKFMNSILRINSQHILFWDWYWSNSIVNKSKDWLRFYFKIFWIQTTPSINHSICWKNEKCIFKYLNFFDFQMNHIFEGL